MSLFDALGALGIKISAKQRREIRRAAAELQEALRAHMEAEGSPQYLECGEFYFVFNRIGEPQPGEWHLCGEPPMMRECVNATTAPHLCRVYWCVQSPSRRPRAAHDAPPPPPRPSGASQIRSALKTLGVSERTYPDGPPTAPEIRAAFIGLSKQFHPDKNPGDRAAEIRYKEITAAYTLLKENGIA